MEEAFHTLYWALYGYSPPNFADVVVSNAKMVIQNQTVYVANDHRFTEIAGKFMYAIYNVIAIVILLNLLIGILSTTFAQVQVSAILSIDFMHLINFTNLIFLQEMKDTEWKFARTQIWVRFFTNESSTLPPPFNLVPSPKSFMKIFTWLIQKIKKNPTAKYSFQVCDANIMIMHLLYMCNHLNTFYFNF